jgi:Tol biopolymer transport system component
MSGFLAAAVLMTCAGTANAAPANGRIAFNAMRSDGASDIATVKPDGKGWIDLTPGSHGMYCAPAWSPDGTRLAFVEPRPQLPGDVDPGNGYLHVMNADGSNDHVLTLARASHECIRPTWSADGSYIAYGGFDGTNFSQVYAIASNGLGVPTRVTEGDIPVTNPSWSTDGTQIAYDGMDGNLYTTPVSQGATGLSFGTRHRVGFALGTNPDWSPDDARLALSRSDELPGIWTTGSSDGSEPQQVTSGSFADDPSWSPDGTAIAFGGTSPAGATEIFRTAADGSGAPVQVTVSTAHGFDVASQPDWQRRGH